MRPALPSARTWPSGTGVPVARHRMLVRPTVPAGRPGPLRISKRIRRRSRSTNGCAQVTRPFLVERANERASGMGPPHAGFGDLTVRTQIQASTVASPPPCSGGSVTLG